MRVRVVHIIRKRRGAPLRRESHHEVETFTVGRGADNDLQLSGLFLSLHHCAFHLRPDGLFIEPREVRQVSVDGQRSSGRVLAPGSEIDLGDHALRLAEPAPGEDLVLEVERVKPASAPPIRFLPAVNRGWLSKSVLSGLLASVILLLFLAAPLLGLIEWPWTSGQIARVHSFIANDCARCHAVAFQRVRDAECLACHASVGRHAPAEIRLARLDETRCASCHLEHNGPTGLAPVEQRLCTECHAHLKAQAPDTRVGDAADFAGKHPEFRLSVFSSSEGVEPERLSWSRELRERSGVEFNHLRHVGQRVVDGRTGEKRSVKCGECHELEAGGQYMRPVVFESHCQRCHSLEFDPGDPERQALHGDPGRTREDLEAYYARRAYLPRPDDPPVSEPAARRAIQRVIPGVPPPPEVDAVLRAWIGDQVGRACRFLMSHGKKKGQCAVCHEVRGTAENGCEGVAPVRVQQIWMPKGEFRHQTHSPFACRTCHAAAAVFDPEFAPGLEPPAWARPGAGPYELSTPAQLAADGGLLPSEQAADVLIPSRDTCRTCHSGPRGDRVASDCVLCHPFHRAEHGPIRKQASVHEAKVERRFAWAP